MNLTLGIAGVLSIGAVYVLLPIFAGTYRRLRGRRVVRCPETSQATVVELDAVRGAGAALLGRSTVRVEKCLLWTTSPLTHQNCDQECLKQVSVEAAQDHGLPTS